MSETEPTRLLKVAEDNRRLGMWWDTWNGLEELPPEDRVAGPEILSALKKHESAAVLAESLVAKG